MTCRKCLHAPVCFDSEGTTRYYGPEIAANNVEELCIHFVDRSRYVVREKGEWRLETDEEEPNPLFKLGVCRVCNQTSSETRNFCPNCGADMRKGENG